MIEVKRSSDAGCADCSNISVPAAMDVRTDNPAWHNSDNWEESRQANRAEEVQLASHRNRSRSEVWLDYHRLCQLNWGNPEAVVLMFLLQTQKTWRPSEFATVVVEYLFWAR